MPTRSIWSADRGKEFIGLPQRTLAKLDQKTLGLRGLMLLAAAPNVGKTALAVQLGTDIVLHNDDAAFLFFSLEMRRGEIVTRIRSRLSELDWATLVFGSLNNNGRHQPGHLPEDCEKLRRGDATLMTIGQRIRILDDRNCPFPTLDKILWHVKDLKASTGVSRVFILVDYLQVWPVPDALAGKLRTQVEVDKWQIGQMKELRNALQSEDGEASVMVISEARKPSGNAGESWGGAMADVMGSARGSYTPDMVFMFRSLQDGELAHLFDWTPPPKEKKTEAKENAARKRWAKAQRALMGKSGLSLCCLDIPKGRDGVMKDEMPLTFWFKRSDFKGGWAKEGLEKADTPEPGENGDEEDF